MEKIAFLGLGAMGSRMCRNLLKAGYPVTVWNRGAEAAQRMTGDGAVVAGSPREAVAGADFVISMVTDDEAARQVWLDEQSGAARALAPQAIAIECSTVTPGWIDELGKALSKGGEQLLLDAPVVGSRPQAEAAQLVFLVGGESEALARVTPALRTMSSAIHHAGQSGAGVVLKLAVNSLLAIQVAAVGELLGLIGRAGLDRKAAWDVIATLAVTSPAAAGAAKLILNDDYKPLFPVSLVNKDLRYALQLAQTPEAQLPMVSAAKAQYQRAIDSGFGEENLGAVSKLY